MQIGRIDVDRITGHSEKSFHESERKTALKNEDDLTES